ncbi:MAG: hypothetical protein ACLVAW_21075 [Eisenbergiella massiliensis]
MWKDYSSGFIKNNKASSLSIMAAALIAALFLSFLCTLFYNFWMDETARIILEDGDWDGRITGEISELQLSTIKALPTWKRPSSTTPFPAQKEPLWIFIFTTEGLHIRICPDSGKAGAGGKCGQL